MSGSLSDWNRASKLPPGKHFDFESERSTRLAKQDGRNKANRFSGIREAEPCGKVRESVVALKASRLLGDFTAEAKPM